MSGPAGCGSMSHMSKQPVDPENVINGALVSSGELNVNEPRALTHEPVGNANVGIAKEKQQ